MKIMKLSQINQFENEGRDPLELPERETSESQQEFNEQSLGKKGQVFTAELLNLITKTVGNKINSSYVATGSVAWVEYKDIIYEILVSPVSEGRYFSYFKDLQSKPLNQNEDNENVENITTRTV